MPQSSPRPPLYEIPRWVLRFVRDPLGALQQMRDTYGGIVGAHLGPYKLYFIFDPDYIHDVMVRQASKFHRTQLIKQSALTLIGNGLIASEGEFWKRQRKLMQPAFHHERIQKYTQVMQSYTLEMLDRWENGKVYDIDHEMIKLALGIVSKTLFGTEIGETIASNVDKELRLIQGLAAQHAKMMVPIPSWLPLPSKIRKEAAIQRLNDLLMNVIAERHKSIDKHEDLLGMFMEARDEDGSGMTDQQLRDEVVTIFLTGHDTSANVLSWALYLLAKNPEVAKKLACELDMVVGNRPTTHADLANLPYTEMVVKETLRLYPPAWLIGRDATEDLEIDGYTIPKGSAILISMYALHRDPRFFENPDAFIPERFADEKNIPPRAYIPFGAGPRFCIGGRYGLVEVNIVLALIMQRYRFELTERQEIPPVPELTLHPLNGIPVRVLEREKQVAFADEL